MGFWDDLMGRTASDASNRAAQDTYGKQLQAGGQIRAAGDQYQTDMGSIAKAYDPYVQGGNSALGRLLQGLGLPGGDGGDFTASYRALPGYQSGLETGQNAALRGINASGMSNSGAALKALQRYGSDYEDQRSGSYLDRLFGLSGQGMQATGAQTGLQGQGAQGRLGAYTTAGQGDYGAAGTIGQGQVAGEQSRSDALSRLLGVGSYLGGSFLGGAGKNFKIPGFS
jgi:hypothetical protein